MSLGMECEYYYGPVCDNNMDCCTRGNPGCGCMEEAQLSNPDNEVYWDEDESEKETTD